MNPIDRLKFLDVYGSKRDYKKYRDFLAALPDDHRLCFCLTGDRVQFCDEHDQRRSCAHKAEEITDLVYAWLDGKTTKAQLRSALEAWAKQKE